MSPSAARRGNTCSRNIGCSSFGGPGSMHSTRPSCSTQRPGAVPFAFASTSPREKRYACLRLFGVIRRPMRAKRSMMVRSISASKTNSWPSTSAIASRVRSSQVGPSPPVVMITSARAQLSRN